jgi:hypothetical protein
MQQDFLMSKASTLRVERAIPELEIQYLPERRSDIDLS